MRMRNISRRRIYKGSRGGQLPPYQGASLGRECNVGSIGGRENDGEVSNRLFGKLLAFEEKSGYSSMRSRLQLE